jgi:hypothetical protein
MKMFINPLDNMKACYVGRDDASYGKFTCVYSTGENMAQFKRHIKTGFNSPAEAISWYFEVYPAGNVMTQESFLNLQAQMLSLKLPSENANMFNPTYMVVRQKPTPVKKTKDGQIISDFE